MASLWWHSRWVRVSVDGPATVDGLLAAIKGRLEDKGYNVYDIDESSLSAMKDSVDVSVIYEKGSRTGTFPDGKPWVQVFKIVQCAADDNASAESTVDDIWAMIEGISFL